MAPTTASQRVVTSGSVTQPYGICEVGHQGLMHDEECGLVYARTRILLPETARWLQRDSSEYSDGLNLYQLEVSRPVTTLDPTGLESIGIDQCQHKCDQVAKAGKQKGLPKQIIDNYLADCYQCCGTAKDNSTCAGAIPIQPHKPVGPGKSPDKECHLNHF
jgi:RHS repeat-associated protein